ncbi:hypothetical protein WJ438_09340 [Streptomyces sp. GD-15H]|uniref:hypothetical protein n=1 Tax=Streptomyces sp. GD-15H TaxID=3129112 RepID=UPI00325127F3
MKHPSSRTIGALAAAALLVPLMAACGSDGKETGSGTEAGEERGRDPRRLLRPQ